MFAKMASPKPKRTKRTSRRQQGLQPLVEGTEGVVGSAETGSPSRETLGSLREASTTYPAEMDIQNVKVLLTSNYTTMTYFRFLYCIYCYTGRKNTVSPEILSVPCWRNTIYIVQCNIE